MFRIPGEIETERMSIGWHDRIQHSGAYYIGMSAHDHKLQERSIGSAVERHPLIAERVDKIGYIVRVLQRIKVVQIDACRTQTLIAGAIKLLGWLQQILRNKSFND